MNKIGMGVFVILLSGLVVTLMSAPPGESIAGVELLAGDLHPSETLAEHPISVKAPTVSAPEPARALVPVVLPVVEKNQETVEPQRDLFLLRGRIHLLDSEGLPLDPPDGNLGLTAWDGGEGTILSVHVVEGEWQIPIEKLQGRSTLSLDRFRLGKSMRKEYAVLDSPIGRLDLPKDHFLEVQAHLPPATTLRVIDRISGAELTGVTVVYSDSGDREFLRHPGLEPSRRRILGSGLRSPIQLSGILSSRQRKMNRRVLVHAEGYAWEAIELLFDRGGEHLLALVGSGTLDIELANYDPRSGAQLRLRTQEGRQTPIYMGGIGDQRSFQIRGLTPGAVTVSVEQGSFFQSPEVLGSVDVQVLAGEVTHVPLTTSAIQPVTTGPLAGRVLLPDGWDLRRLKIGALLKDDPVGGFARYQTVSSGPRSSDGTPLGFKSLAFQFDDIQAGLYELQIGTLLYSYELDVPAGGRTDVLLEPASPTTLVLRLIDAATGLGVTARSVRLQTNAPGQVDYVTSKTMDWDSKTKSYTSRVSGSAVTVNVHSMDYAWVPERIVVKGSLTEAELYLNPATRIDVQLYDGATRVPFSKTGYQYPAAAPGYSGEAVMLSMSDPLNWRCQVSEPGLYEWTLQPISGFLPIPIQRIDALEGQTTLVKIQLERAN